MQYTHGFRPVPAPGKTLKRLVLGLSLVLGVFATLPAQATSMKHRTIVDLIQLSELIVVGRVVSVTDGFENGVPFTEITLSVGESLKGVAGEVYTFRQFGLRAPRKMDNGLTYIGVSPDGWPRFQTGENVVLFLYRESAKTGLRTTVGLGQGKFLERDGQITNDFDNLALFRNVSISEDLLSPREAKMLKKAKGEIPAEIFYSFVRKTVRNRWIEAGKLDHVK